MHLSLITCLCVSIACFSPCNARQSLGFTQHTFLLNLNFNHS
uniref:Uncharacterized protein n=1 Tax=Anguilla anguilla TaxID=7936 RepID=A0A0E9UWB8_ANGAN